MMMKVYGGTGTQQGESMCDTCRHSKIIRGRRLEEELVFCTGIALEPVTIRFKVTACSGYDDDREPSYHELLEKAWILRPPTTRRAAGFVRASDLRGEEARRLFADPTEE